MELLGVFHRYADLGIIRMLFLLSAFLLVLVFFESAQQYYYVIQFDLIPRQEVSFRHFLSGHAFRWGIWLLLACCYLYHLTRQSRLLDNFQASSIGALALQILGLLVLNIVGITLLQLGLNAGPWTGHAIGESFIFFFFQKSPLFVLAYTGIVAMAFLVKQNGSLQQKMEEIAQLANQHQGRIEALLAQRTANGLPGLNVKKGRNDFMLPLEQIVWIEAYDYYVKVHATQRRIFTLRSSLKTLERELPELAFQRVHRSSIVNMQWVRKIDWSTGNLQLEDRQEVEVAKSRYKQLREFVRAHS